jgi:hypothetical protein
MGTKSLANSVRGWVGQRDRFVHERVRSIGPYTLYEEWVAFEKRISSRLLAIGNEICETWERRRRKSDFQEERRFRAAGASSDRDSR